MRDPDDDAELSAADADDTQPSSSRTILVGGKGPSADIVRRFVIDVVDGPSSRVHWESSEDRCAIGSEGSNDIVIEDQTVSRFHCEIRLDEGKARIRDLGSSNGTIVDRTQIVDAYLRGGATVRLGLSTFRFNFANETNRLRVSERTQFGSLVGTSSAMRAAFALLEKAAESDVTVLLEGETGTGKEGAATAIHRASARRDQPFVVIDCSAIPENLLESELFGHEKGSFTGALVRRIGAFEEASGGTVFLDEIGELPFELQPKLLRALEAREIRRVGANLPIPINVRVIAATNRDLRAEVNAGRFRADVYYRLAVLRVPLPSLRSRPEDIPALATKILASLSASEEVAREIMKENFTASLQRASWPGNVRELRNHLERCLIFREPLPIVDDSSQAPPRGYVEARRHAIAQFEKEYITQLLARHGNNVATAAEEAGIGRVYVYRIMQRNGIKPDR